MERHGPDHPTAGETPAQAQRRARAQLALQRLDALPTLRSVAVRILEVTGRDDADAAEVVRLVSSDGGLATRVLKLCRCSHRGRHTDVRTVERAVLMMGFDAVRTAVLSVEVYDLLQACPPNEGRGAGASSSLLDAAQTSLQFDPRLHWHHSLATATLAEAMVRAAPRQVPITPGEALLLGLLHDVGAIALKIVMPRETDEAVRFAQSRGISFDAACRVVMGIDSHTAGKRLAEHWGLPEIFRDVMWLHGQPLDALPAEPAQGPLVLIGYADQLARRCYLAPTDQGRAPLDEQVCQSRLALTPPQLERIIEALPAEVRQRAEALGLDDEPDDHALLAALCRANAQLSRLGQRLHSRSGEAAQCERALEAIRKFHADLNDEAGLEQVMPVIMRSLAGLTGGGLFLVIDRLRSAQAHRLVRYDAQGRTIDSRVVADEDVPSTPALRSDTTGAQAARRLGPALRDLLDDDLPAQQLRVLPLPAEPGETVLVLHDAPGGRELDEELLSICRRTWRSALIAARQHDAARDLSEQLATTNRALLEAQEDLARSRALASVGEIAAGAAHEMNNPLTVIAGRSQLLARELTDDAHRAQAQQIAEAAARLSAMITSLERFAHPEPPLRKKCRVEALVGPAVAEVRSSAGERIALDVQIDADAALAEAELDESQIVAALVEVLRNAAESDGCRRIVVRVQIDPLDDRLTITVQDDGCGLTPAALRHAFDPFFSAKPAGRRPGLGLSRAQRIVEAHGGTLTLENGPAGGARARVCLSDWRRRDEPKRAVA